MDYKGYQTQWGKYAIVRSRPRRFVKEGEKYQDFFRGLSDLP